MRLLRPADVPALQSGRVCRQSRWMALVATALFAVFLVGGPVALVAMVRPALWITVPVLLVAGWIAVALVRRCVKAFARENWLLRIAPDGLWINLRSYLNSQFAPAATVVHVDYREIESVREHLVHRAEKSDDGVTTWKDRFLDIRLTDVAPPEVAAEISEERRRRVETTHLGGLVTSRGRNNHVPVTMPNDRTLRLAWRGRYDFVTPSLATVLRELATYCQVGEPKVRNFADLQQLTGEEVDRLILESVESGDTMGAVKLLCDRRGYTVTDAKRFVDELTLKL